MKIIKMLLSTINFKLEGNFPSSEYCPFGYDLGDNYSILLYNFFDEDFKDRFGLVALTTFINNPFFYCHLDYSTVEDSKQLSIKDEVSLSVALDCLWFIKDNSAQINVLYQYIPDVSNKTEASYLHHNHFITNSSGKNADTTFTLDELIKSQKILDKIIQLSSSQITLNTFKNDKAEFGTIQNNTIDGLIFKTQNRIERALSFLALARNQGFLPTKITYYMCIYESLFTIENDANLEIIKNVKIRTKKYLPVGLTVKQKKRYGDKLIKAYEVRSRFLHGDSLHNDITENTEDIVELSKNIDNLTRIVLTKVITEDSEHFLKSDNELIEWLESL